MEEEIQLSYERVGHLNEEEMYVFNITPVAFVMLLNPDPLVL